MNEQDIVSNFENDFVGADMKDLSVGILDAGIDLISQSEVVCSIPFIGLLAGM